MMPDQGNAYSSGRGGVNAQAPDTVMYGGRLLCFGNEDNHRWGASDDGWKRPLKCPKRQLPDARTAPNIFERSRCRLEGFHVRSLSMYEYYFGVCEKFVRMNLSFVNSRTAELVGLSPHGAVFNGVLVAWLRKEREARSQTLLVSNRHRLK
jgi:hypothetical protein